MSYLLSVQHGVAWQQRGIATSALQFFRTMAGAVGIGLLGLLFNILAAPQMQQLRAMGVNPAFWDAPEKPDRNCTYQSSLSERQAPIKDGLAPSPGSRAPPSPVDSP